MVGWGKAPSKLATKFKVVKPATKVTKVQRSIDSYRIAAQSVIPVNMSETQGHDADVDLEVVIDNDRTEWVDVETAGPLGASVQSPSWSQVVSGGTASATHSQSSSQQASGPGNWNFSKDSVQHKAQVQPIFLAYLCVQTRGSVHIPLFQIASSVAEAVGGGSGLDAVQLMCAGWYIYMCTQSDQDQLIQRGIVVAGKLITLCSEVSPHQHDAVKIMLKDSPLHSVSNEQVLEAIKEVCLVQSEV